MAGVRTGVIPLPQLSSFQLLPLLMPPQVRQRNHRGAEQRRVLEWQRYKMPPSLKLIAWILTEPVIKRTPLPA